MAGSEELARRLNLITRRIPAEDVHGVDIIEDALTAEGKAPRCLWGT
jgi:tyrosyl-tRNA synthetase